MEKRLKEKGYSPFAEYGSDVSTSILYKKMVGFNRFCIIINNKTFNIHAYVEKSNDDGFTFELILKDDGSELFRNLLEDVKYIVFGGDVNE